MTVSGTASSASLYSADTQNTWKQRRQDFKSLESALQSGDLSSAQTAFSAVQKDIKSSPPGTKGKDPFSNNPQASRDFQALQSALQSGDLASAQKAFASFQTDVKGAHGARHHRPPPPSDVSGDTDGSMSNSQAAAQTTAGGSVGTLLNTEA
ncbi:MAG TPA: hypothetical protein VMF06_05340 [Candidatus Limnocylindria bacterium]|jgi:ribosomal protein S20|nr:hypothetical protein [Candidatus Limnocylindria bacterium]